MCEAAGSSAFVTAQSLVEVSRYDEKLPSIPESNRSCARGFKVYVGSKAHHTRMSCLNLCWCL